MKLFPVLLVLLLFANVNCSNSLNSSNMSASYKIINKEKSETSNKAQLKITAYLTDSISSKEALQEKIKEIYNDNKNEGGYNNFSSPTVIAVYIYTSESKAKEMPESWIAMLMKTPSDSEPRISVDEFKLKAQIGENKNEDRVALENLKKYLSERNLELCSLYKTVYDLEGEAIKKADEKFPNYGKDHLDYVDQLVKEEKEKLKSKYNLEDSIFVDINVFASSYCK